MATIDLIGDLDEALAKDFASALEAICDAPAALCRVYRIEVCFDDVRSVRANGFRDAARAIVQRRLSGADVSAVVSRRNRSLRTLLSASRVPVADSLAPRTAIAARRILIARNAAGG